MIAIALPWGHGETAVATAPQTGWFGLFRHHSNKSPAKLHKPAPISHQVHEKLNGHIPQTHENQLHGGNKAHIPHHIYGHDIKVPAHEPNGHSEQYQPVKLVLRIVPNEQQIDDTDPAPPMYTSNENNNTPSSMENMNTHPNSGSISGSALTDEPENMNATEAAQSPINALSQSTSPPSYGSVENLPNNGNGESPNKPEYSIGSAVSQTPSSNDSADSSSTVAEASKNNTPATPSSPPSYESIENVHATNETDPRTQADVVGGGTVIDGTGSPTPNAGDPDKPKITIEPTVPPTNSDVASSISDPPSYESSQNMQNSKTEEEPRTSADVIRREEAQTQMNQILSSGPDSDVDNDNIHLPTYEEVSTPVNVNFLPRLDRL